MAYSEQRRRGINVELRHLRYFIRAAEYLHFTKAAESLYISQPSLSVHIQQLEDELQTKLFDRVGRNVRLTDAGQVLLTRAIRAVAELEAAGKEIEAITGHLRGPLTIATLPLFGSKNLPRWIDAFNLLHRNVRIRVRAMRADDIENGLIAGTFDLGFSLGPPEHSQIQWHDLVSDRIMLVVSRDHPLATKKSLKPADFKSVQLALLSQNFSLMRQTGAYFESIDVVPNIVAEQDDGHAAMELVKLGGFASLMPEAATRHGDDLVFLPLPEPGMSLTFSAMWIQKTPVASAFMEVVTSEKESFVSSERTQQFM